MKGRPGIEVLIGTAPWIKKILTPVSLRIYLFIGKDRIFEPNNFNNRGVPLFLKPGLKSARFERGVR
jgi:hypothetical protein